MCCLQHTSAVTFPNAIAYTKTTQNAANVMHQFPKYLTGTSLKDVLIFCNQVAQDNNEEIICDAEQLKFVDPFGLCALVATKERITDKKKHIRIINISDDVGRYISRMDAFKTCKTEHVETFTRHNQQASLFEVTRLDQASEIESVADRLAIAVVGQIPEMNFDEPADDMTGYTPSACLTKPMKYIFSELLENALTHGRRHGYSKSSVWMASQYYPKAGKIRLAVVDNGCGLLATLQRNPELTENTDIGAIKTALLPKVTCNPAFGINGVECVNQGIGLTIVKDIGERCAATMQFVTGNGSVQITPSHSTSNYIEHGWRGTIINMVVSREKLKSINIHEVIQQYQPVSSGVQIMFE